MPFDFHAFLTLAEELALRDDEASKRTSISRAYYSIFNFAFAKAESNAGRFLGGKGIGMHAWCWEKYRNTDNMACREFGTVGDRMRRRRIKADYRPDIPRLIDEVQLALVEARQLHIGLHALDPRYPTP